MDANKKLQNVADNFHGNMDSVELREFKNCHLYPYDFKVMVEKAFRIKFTPEEVKT
jgi:hypothetical protein